MKARDEVVNDAETGKYIDGLWLEGAAWEAGGQGQEGYLIEQKPKELHPKLPVVNVVSIPLTEAKTVG